MTIHDIGPDYVQFNYHSAAGIHSMSHSVLEWIDAASAGGQGQFATHLAGSIDAVEMVEGFAAICLPLAASTWAFDSWVVFHRPVVGGPSFPVAGANFTAMVGSNTDGSWYKAVQHTMNFRDVEFNAAKAVFLDVNSSGDWSKTFAPSTVWADVWEQLRDPEKGWCSRAGLRIDQAVSYTKDLNDRLRKAYKLS